MDQSNASLPRKGVEAPVNLSHAQISRRTLRHKNELSSELVNPDTWYEPTEDNPPTTDIESVHVIVEPPGEGYRFPVTEEEVFAAIAAIPAGRREQLIRNLEIIKFSGMTRKKKSFQNYGMQWGSTIYLYPVEYDEERGAFVETTSHGPPRPQVMNEVRAFGARLEKEESKGSVEWSLVWSEQALKDFYLYDILIHELAHLEDDKNSNYTDRERYAEAIAIKDGLLRFREQQPPRKIRKRHHSV